MSKKSDAVKNWRRNTKSRMVESMGGSCQICGYNRCNDALELHHIEPSEKEFSFGAITANPKSWKKIVIELRKCILLCANCHREIHNNMVSLPETYARFDESFAEYKLVSNMNSCPVCGNQKSSVNRVCSRVCIGKLRKFDWSSVNLCELLKTFTVTQISEKLNLSVGAIRKQQKKQGL